MPSNQFLNTPEALLGRNDSKNPATTCRGITSTGRPCRRALVLSKNETSESSIGGVIALLKQDTRISDAQFYCWQHKEQAQAAAANADDDHENGHPLQSRTHTEVLQLKNRSSIDTLVQKFGIQSAHDGRTEDQRKVHESRRPSAITERSSRTRSTACSQPHRRPSVSSRQPSAKPQAQSFWHSLCCMLAVDDGDTLEVVRRRKRSEQFGVNVASVPAHTKAHIHHSASGIPVVARTSIPTAKSSSPLALVPPDTSPQIASNILAELSKPLSIHDEEGYIYIFWLTSLNQQDPGESTAQALLTPQPARHDHARRISDVMTEFSYNADDELSSRKAQKTILLKIGRANNVTRRMNEWQRQCGHRLNLVRWYPYVSNSGTTSPLPSPAKASPAQHVYPDLSQHGLPLTSRRMDSNVRKVPNVKRVERLIHLELADQQTRQVCAACGREHREWFKVEASEAGVRKVDAIVRRWVEWSERVS